MKRFTIFMWLLCFMCMGAVAQQDLPELTTDVTNPVLYQIKNLRSHGSRGQTYASTVLAHGKLKLSTTAELNASTELTVGSMWYFTEENVPEGVTLPEGSKAVKIHNLLADKALTDVVGGTWDDSRTWYLIPNSNSDLTGFSIAYNPDLTNDSYSWNNARNEATVIEYWKGNDVGSIWGFERQAETTANSLYSTFGNEIKTKGDTDFADNAAILNKWNSITSSVTWNLSTITTAYNQYPILINEKLSAVITNVENKLDNTVGNCSEISFTLNTDNLTSNAPAATDGGGIAALLDNTTTTFFHSAYSGNGTNPNTYHNLQVDLGEGITANAIQFGFTTRNGNSNNNPRTIRIWGSNDKNTYEEITVINSGLPTTQAASYESRTIAAVKAYRYFRFDIEKTNNNALYGEYPFFSLSEFNFKAYNITAKEGKSNEFVLKCTEIIETAKAVKNNANATTEQQKSACITLNRLTSIIDAPFVISGIGNPDYYAIQVGREGSWFWTLDYLNGGKAKLENTASTDVANQHKDANKYWFFTLSDNAYLQIIPMAEPTAPMGYITVGGGADKLTNVSTTTNFAGTEYEYVPSGNADFPIAFKPAGQNTYVSNHGGVASGFYYLGFYNELNDGGTRMKLEALTAPDDVDKIVAIQAAVKTVPNSLIGSGVGRYSYNETARNNAIDCLKDVDTANKTSILEAAQNMYVLNAPETGKFYRFKNVASDKYLTSTLTDTKMTMAAATGDGINTVESIFYLTDENKLVAYSNGLYTKDWTSDTGGTGVNYGFMDAGGAGNVVSFPAGTPYNEGTPYYNMNCGNRSLYGNGNSGGTTVVDGGANVTTATGDSGYYWIIEEVGYLPISMGDYATFYSPVPLSRGYGDIERVKAYTGELESGRFVLTEIEGNIPANTPVILEYKNEKQDNGCVYLEVVADADNANANNNSLSGTFVTIPKENVNATGTICTMQMLNDELGFYRFNGDNLGGFKAYLDVPAEYSQSGLRIVIGGEETGIDNVAAGKNDKEVYYDLNGRPVLYPAHGIYVTGSGKKVFFK